MKLLTAVALFMTIPAIVGIFQRKEKDEITLYLLLSLLLISLYFAFFPYVDQFQSWFDWHRFFNQFLSVAALTLAILISRRLEKKMVAGMMICSASLITLSTFAIIQAIYG